MNQPLPTQYPVKVLDPATYTGLIGRLLGQELLPNGQATGRWLIQIDEDTILSLTTSEFYPLPQTNEEC